MKRIALALLALTAIVAVAVPNFADDPKPTDKPGGPGDEQMKKMMEECMKLATPEEHHKHMAPLAGKWSCKGKFRMDPNMPWIESTSECESEWILGGRFLVQKVKGEPMMGMTTPFEGFGLMGYDNLLKKYTHVWADNMGTMQMVSEGTCDSSGKTITLSSKFTDPMTRQPTSMKSIYKIESNDKYVLSMTCPGPDGKEFVCMELVETRKK